MMADLSGTTMTVLLVFTASKEQGLQTPARRGLLKYCGIRNTQSSSLQSLLNKYPTIMTKSSKHTMLPKAVAHKQVFFSGAAHVFFVSFGDFPPPCPMSGAGVDNVHPPPSQSSAIIKFLASPLPLTDTCVYVHFTTPKISCPKLLF